MLSHISDCEQYALEILNSHGVKKYPTNPKRKKMLVPMRQFISALEKASDKKLLWYARAVMEDAYQLRCALQEGELEKVARAGIALGRNLSRLESHPYEKAVGTGRKGQEYMAKMREARSKKTDTKRNKIIDLFNELKDQYEPHERPRDRAIIKEVSQYLRLPFKTVESTLYRASKASAK